MSRQARPTTHSMAAPAAPPAGMAPWEAWLGGLLLVPYALLAWRFWFTCEDAFITFRYARNWAAGNGLRYNIPENPPVEGYTNFLWTAVCAVLELLHLDMERWPALLCFACGGALLVIFYRALRRWCAVGVPAAALATLCLGCFPPYALWSSSGLETMPLALVMFITFERLVLRAPTPAPLAAGLAGLATALMRADGIAWAVLIGALAVLSSWLGNRRDRRSLLLYFAILGTGYAVYSAARYAYFGEWLPNTAHAKMGMSGPFLWRSARYLLVFFLSFVSAFVFIPAAVAAWRSPERARGIPVVLMLLASLGYCFLAGGDWMPMGRMLVPGFVVFSAVLLAWLLEGLARRPGRGPGLAAGLAGVVLVLGLLPAFPGLLGLIPSFDGHVVPRSVREKLHFRHNIERYRSEYDQWLYMSRDASKYRSIGKTLKVNTAPGDSLVVGPIGYIGYFSELFIYDQNGLVTPEVAKRKVAADEELRSPGHDKHVEFPYFLKDRPTWILPRFHPVNADSLVTLIKQTVESQIAQIYVADFFELVLPVRGNDLGTRSSSGGSTRRQRPSPRGGRSSRASIPCSATAPPRPRRGRRRRLTRPPRRDADPSAEHRCHPSQKS